MRVYTLRAINQELWWKGGGNKSKTLLFVFKGIICRWNLVHCHPAGGIITLSLWITVLAVSELGSPSWMSYENKHLKELHYFKKEIKWEKRLKVEFFYCLYSYLTHENVIEETCEMVHIEVGIRPWETHGVIIALIFSMALNSYLNRNGCCSSGLHY